MLPTASATRDPFPSQAMRIRSISFFIPALLLLWVAASPAVASAQDLHPSRRPSPVGIAKVNLGDTYVKVTYGRPYMRGREVFGAPEGSTTYLVPFGQLWRTGANEATEITATGDILLGGRRLAAGTYSVFTVPGPTSWSLRFNAALGLDGTNRQDPETGEFRPAYDTSRDVLQVDVPSSTLDEVVDQLTITLERTATGADLVLRWERTEVRVPVSPAR